MTEREENKKEEALGKLHNLEKETTVPKQWSKELLFYRLGQYLTLIQLGIYLVLAAPMIATAGASIVYVNTVKSMAEATSWNTLSSAVRVSMVANLTVPLLFDLTISVTVFFVGLFILPEKWLRRQALHLTVWQQHRRQLLRAKRKAATEQETKELTDYAVSLGVTWE